MDSSNSTPLPGCTGTAEPGGTGLFPQREEAAAAVSTTELLPAGPISALACDDDDGNDNSVRVGNDQHSDSEQV